MISLTTKAYLSQNKSFQVMLPDELELSEGEYEVVLVLLPVESKSVVPKKKLIFTSHDYFLPESNTFSRNDIFDDYGR